MLNRRRNRVKQVDVVIPVRAKADISEIQLENEIRKKVAEQIPLHLQNIKLCDKVEKPENSDNVTPDKSDEVAEKPVTNSDVVSTWRTDTDPVWASTNW